MDLVHRALLDLPTLIAKVEDFKLLRDVWDAMNPAEREAWDGQLWPPPSWRRPTPGSC